MDPNAKAAEEVEKARIKAEAKAAEDAKAFKDRIDGEIEREDAARHANLEEIERQERQDAAREAMVLEADRARWVAHFMEHRFELYEAVSSDELRASARRTAAIALWDGAFGHRDHLFHGGSDYYHQVGSLFGSREQK